MKIKKFIYFFTFVFISFNSNAYVINEKISNKYNQIFTENILSSKDINNYQKIFISQENCEWKKANRDILRVENKILIGHVLAQRYLHPRCYKSEFVELTYWLKKYNDHPQAKKIYRLAISRMPKGYKSPAKPIKPTGIIKEELNSTVQKKSYKSNKKLSKNQRIEKRKLINAIKSRVNKGWPTGAVKLLQQRDVYTLLDQIEIDQQKELIAKAILAEGINLSIRYDCVISEWEISKKLKINIISDSNVKKMKSQSFNLFLNENYTVSEVNDIYAAFKKVADYFLNEKSNKI